MATIYRAEPFIKIVPGSSVPIRAPRAAPRRMALTLLVGLALFWVPMLIGGEIRMALFIAALPLAMFLSTFRGANTLRLDRKRERLTIRRHYFLWSTRVGESSTTDVEQVSVDRRFERAYEESPLNAISALVAPIGIHAHFGGREVTVPVWDLVITLRTTEVMVVISCEEKESAEAARSLLEERLKIGPVPGA